MGSAATPAGTCPARGRPSSAWNRHVEGGKHHYRYRALDQPACGMQRRAGRTTLFVQREVPGIYGEGQDCCHKPITRLEAVDVSRWA